MTYIFPKVGEGSFTCPNCGVVANQSWIGRNPKFHQMGSADDVIRTAHCDHCHNYSLWHEDTMVFPVSGIAPPPNPDLPDLVGNIYREAASIASLSPRGAAGLLRLAIQLLCKELGETGDNINNDIGSLVRKGLPVNVQKSLDIVRVTGNQAVHPGQIDTDNIEVTLILFGLINIICEYMITLPKQVNRLYSGLPAGTLAAITKRDSKTL